MYSETIDLLDSYRREVVRTKVAGFNGNLAGEVKERLLQLNYLIEKVQIHVGIALSEHMRATEPVLNHIFDLMAPGIRVDSVPAPPELAALSKRSPALKQATFEARLLAESFYYFAFRVRTIVKHRSHPLPGLQGFECVGVRTARNQLLEHAGTGQSEITTQYMAISNKVGLILKAIRYSGQGNEFADKGLYPNAEEFRANLDAVLRAQIAALRAVP